MEQQKTIATGVCVDAKCVITGWVRRSASRAGLQAHSCPTDSRSYLADSRTDSYVHTCPTDSLAYLADSRTDSYTHACPTDSHKYCD